MRLNVHRRTPLNYGITFNSAILTLNTLGFPSCITDILFIERTLLAIGLKKLKKQY